MLGMYEMGEHFQLKRWRWFQNWWSKLRLSSAQGRKLKTLIKIDENYETLMKHWWKHEMVMFSVAEAKTQPMVKFSEKLAICPKT